MAASDDSTIPVIHINTLIEVMDDSSLQSIETTDTNGNSIITTTFTVSDMDGHSIQVERTVTYDRSETLINHLLTFTPDAEIKSDYPMQSLSAREKNPKTLLECIVALEMAHDLEKSWFKLTNIMLCAITELKKVNHVIENIDEQLVHSRINGDLITTVMEMRSEVNTQEDYDRIMKCFDHNQYRDLLSKDIKEIFNDCRSYNKLLEGYGVDLTEAFNKSRDKE